jgi:hypothetical protein
MKNNNYFVTVGKRWRKRPIGVCLQEQCRTKDNLAIAGVVICRCYEAARVDYVSVQKQVADSTSGYAKPRTTNPGLAREFSYYILSGTSIPSRFMPVLTALAIARDRVRRKARSGSFSSFRMEWS